MKTKNSQPAQKTEQINEESTNAWHFVHDPEILRFLEATCRRMVASSSSNNPGYEPGDLLSEVLWRLRNSRCPAIGAFINLFKKAAWSRMVELHRSSQRRKRVFDDCALVDAEPADEEFAVSPDCHAAWEISAVEEQRQFCLEMLDLLSKLQVKIAHRPVLKAIIEEAISGYRVPDREIAGIMSVTANKVCKIRCEIRRRLSFLLREELGAGMHAPQKKCPLRKNFGRNFASRSFS